MWKPVLTRIVFLFFLISIMSIMTAGPVFATGVYLRPANDSNTRLEIQNAVVRDDETTILFHTWPYLGDPNNSKPCPVNYYAVTVNPGMSTAQPKLMARNVCAGQARLLESGVIRLISLHHLEEWRAGERLSQISFTSIKPVANLGISSVERGTQTMAFSPSGDLLVAVRVGGQPTTDWPGKAYVVASLKPDNSKRWLLSLDKAEEDFLMLKLWAGDDGGALIYTTVFSKKASIPDEESRLIFVSKNGDATIIDWVKMAEPFDLASIKPGSREDFQRAIEHQKNNRSETIENLTVKPASDSGFDVLFERKSTRADRNGVFLMHLNADGTIQSETNFGSLFVDHGLVRWVDFYIADHQLVLFSSYSVSQTGVNSRRKTWPQNLVSWIDIQTLSVESRLIPLDRQYLEAAMNAGDEGQQYLEAQPGSEPVLLTTLGNIPLVAGRRYQKGGAQLSLHETTQDLVVFTEAYDKSESGKAGKKNASRQKTARQARKDQMEDTFASITGVSREEFDNLDDTEKAGILVKEGNMQALMDATMKQMQGGMTAEQLSKMQAQANSVQQTLPGAGTVVDTTLPEGASNAAPSVAKSEASFTVDGLKRGHLQYQHPNGEAVIISVINRQSGDELLSKEFEDGKIDEYLNLGQYKLPMDQLGVLIKNQAGKTIEDLTP